MDFKTALNPKLHRVRRSISDKSQSKQDKYAQRRLGLAAELRRAGRKSVKAINAYFGLIQRDKTKKNPENGASGNHDSKMDKKEKKPSLPKEHSEIPQKSASVLMIPGVVHIGSDVKLVELPILKL